MSIKTVQPHKNHILILEDDKGRRDILLTKKKYSLGRDRDCDLRIYSLFVSRHHATLIQVTDSNGCSYYEVYDGDDKGKPSVNGILINGQKVNNKKLQDGDKLIFGPQVKATYQYRQIDIFPTMPTNDPFDITLIDPAMIDRDHNLDEEHQYYQDDTQQQ